MSHVRAPLRFNGERARCDDVAPHPAWWLSTTCTEDEGRVCLPIRCAHEKRVRWCRFHAAPACSPSATEPLAQRFRELVRLLFEGPRAPHQGTIPRELYGRLLAADRALIMGD